jgi:hypothetical protein
LPENPPYPMPVHASRDPFLPRGLCLVKRLSAPASPPPDAVIAGLLRMG